MSTLAKPNTKVKKALKARGFTYKQVAALCGVSWFMVYAVLAGKRKSARVMSAIDKLLGTNGGAA